MGSEEEAVCIFITVWNQKDDPPLMSPTLYINYRLFVLSRHSLTFRTITTTASSSTAAPKVPITPNGSFSSSGVRFELSHLPSNPLGEGRWIKTAGAIIIGCVFFEEGGHFE